MHEVNQGVVCLEYDTRSDRHVLPFLFQRPDENIGNCLAKWTEKRQTHSYHATWNARSQFNVCHRKENIGLP